VGQPLRAWFTFWYPNVHSMLTEVTFCISCYLTVLAIEYLPIVLRNRKLRQVPSFLVFEFELHKLIYVLAGVGTFLSFFHQGSLGGLYGVLRGRPFAFREGLAVWPSTFFLFIISAAAVGPSFILLTTWLVEKSRASGWCGRKCCSFWADFGPRCWPCMCWPRASTRWSGSIAPRPADGFPGLAILQLETVRHRGFWSRKSACSACCPR
jgi:menaquinone reductase, integral membrane subunit